MICSRCREELPDREFYMLSDGYRRTVCKSCCKQRDKTRVEARRNREISQLIHQAFKRAGNDFG